MVLPAAFGVAAGGGGWQLDGAFPRLAPLPDGRTPFGSKLGTGSMKTGTLRGAVVIALSLLLLGTGAMAGVAAPIDPPPEVVDGTTRLTVSDDPRDSQGVAPRSWGLLDGTFDVTGSQSLGRVIVWFRPLPTDADSSPWSLMFFAREGTALTAGSYPNTGTGFHEDGGAQLWVSANHVTCDGTGGFDVLELVWGEDGTVERFSADFVHFCGDLGSDRVTGDIRYHALGGGFVAADQDGDRVSDTLDNCAAVANGGQVDRDNDSVGDRCDPSGPHTSLEIRGEPHDTMTGGTTMRFAATDGVFSAIGYGTAIGFTFANDDIGFDVWLGPGAERSLAVGPFDDAVEDWYAKAPYLRFSRHAWPVCTEPAGRFDVRELLLGEHRSVQRLVADFEYRCHAVALRGRVSYHASRVTGFPAPPDADADLVPDTRDNCDHVVNRTQADADRDAIGDACDAAAEHFEIRVDREPASYVPNGGRSAYYRSDSSIAAQHVDVDGRRQITVYGDAPYHWVSPRFATGAATIEPGRYSNDAAIAPLAASLGCNFPSGTLDVDEAALGPVGQVERFAATFELRCSHNPAWVRGRVLYNASSAPLPEAPFVLRQPFDQRVRAGETMTLSAAAGGAPAPAARWSRSVDGGASWTAISGGVAPVYSHVVSAADSATMYRAVFQNASGKAVTQSVRLTVL